MRPRIKGAETVDLVPTLIRTALCIVFHTDLGMDVAGVPRSICKR